MTGYCDNLKALAYLPGLFCLRTSNCEITNQIIHKMDEINDVKQYIIHDFTKLSDEKQLMNDCSLNVERLFNRGF